MNVKNCRKCGRIFNYIGGQPICPTCREEAEKKFETVKNYIKENHLTVTGPLRLIWLEGPTALGNQPERFLNKILYPIKKG